MARQKSEKRLSKSVQDRMRKIRAKMASIHRKALLVGKEVRATHRRITRSGRPRG